MKRIINGREVNLFEKTMFFIGCFTGGITCGAMIGLLLFSIILFLGTHSFVEKGKYMLKTDCVQATPVPAVDGIEARQTDTQSDTLLYENDLYPSEDIRMTDDSLSDRDKSVDYLRE